MNDNWDDKWAEMQEIADKMGKQVDEVAKEIRNNFKDLRVLIVEQHMADLELQKANHSDNLKHQDTIGKMILDAIEGGKDKNHRGKCPSCGKDVTVFDEKRWKDVHGNYYHKGCTERPMYVSVGNAGV